MGAAVEERRFSAASAEFGHGLQPLREFCTVFLSCIASDLNITFMVVIPTLSEAEGEGICSLPTPGTLQRTKSRCRRYSIDRVFRSADQGRTKLRNSTVTPLSVRL